MLAIMTVFEPDIFGVNSATIAVISSQDTLSTRPYNSQRLLAIQRIKKSVVRYLSLKTRKEVIRTCAENPAIVRLGIR
jgi:hypothetical protein